MKKKELYCLDCKKFVKARILPYGTGMKVCAECWGNRVLDLEEISEEEFEKLKNKIKEG